MIFIDNQLSGSAFEFSTEISSFHWSICVVLRWALKFSDIWDDMLHVTQEKTGSRLAIPLDLTCGAINISLREVVAKCRDAVLSQYLVHFRHTTSQAVRRIGFRLIPSQPHLKKPETGAA